MKRGLLFSIMTFLMLFSLILFSQAILRRDLSTNEVRVTINSPARASLIESYATDDLLSILNISKPQLNRSVTRGEVVVLFSNFSVIPITGLPSALSRYETFFENNYSMLESLILNLTGTAMNITLSGYNTTFSLNQNDTTITTLYHSQLKVMEVVIKLNATSPFNTSVPSSSTGNPNVSVTVLDSAGAVVIATNISLSPIAENANISVFHNGRTPRLDISFGSFSGVNGVLRIATIDMVARPQDLKIVYQMIPQDVRLEFNSTLTYQDGMLYRSAPVLMRRV